MRKRLHDWDGLIAEFEASGLSRAEFCRRRKLKYQTMSNWILRQSQSPFGSKRATDDKSRTGRRAERRRSARGSASCSARGSASCSANGSASGSTNGSPRFAEVSVQLGAAAHTYEIVLGAGRSIRVPATFDADTVARLIQVVESC